MKIAITGAEGMLGRALQASFSSRHDVSAWTRGDLDICDAPAVAAKLEEGGFDWLLNAAAYTKVDEADREPDEAFRANLMGCRNLASACSESGCRLFAVSTDYVFDGSSLSPYPEWSPPAPLNVYGQSKWAGEQAVRQLCSRHLIVRTSWLYGAGGRHFVDTMLSLAGKRTEIEVVADQVGSPTWTEDLARMVVRLVEDDCSGTYHITNGGSCSWYEFARAIIAEAGLNTTVNATTTADYGRKHLEREGWRLVDRPSYSVLDNAMLRLEGRTPLRPWRESLKAFLESRR